METTKPLANSEAQTDRTPREELSVEMRIHEQRAEVLHASGAEAAVAPAAQDRVLRWTVLGAVLAIAATYVFALIGSGWVPADDGILSQGALRV
ncbi:MAG: hypothetical protein WBW01_16725, partial [Terriglobales bacterium]